MKSSQGFDWNQGTEGNITRYSLGCADSQTRSELFLPSYIDHDSHELEHKQDPVQDIILTDEEAAAMLPQ